MINILPGLAIAVMHPLYYLVLELAIEFGFNPTTATYPARILTLLLLGLLFFFSIAQGRLKAKWSWLHLSLLMFMGLYLARIYTLHADQTWNLPDDTFPKVFTLFLLGIILPCILTLFSSTLFSRPSTSRIFIFCTFLSVAGIALMNLDQFGTARTKGIEEGGIASLAMGYIAVLGIGYCFLDYVRLKRYSLLVLIPVLICCAFLVAISASRGPLLALAASVIYIFLTMEKSSRNILGGVLIVAATVSAGYLYVVSSGSGLVDRVARVTDNIESGERADARVGIYAESIQTIKENWLTGKDIAVESGTWPHNYVLEAIMAVGVCAIFMFIPWIVALFKTLSDAKSDNNQWLYVWIIQLSVMNMFTEAIWSGSLFICIFLVLGAQTYSQANSGGHKKRRRRKRRGEHENNIDRPNTDDAVEDGDLPLSIESEPKKSKRRRRKKRKKVWLPSP